MKNLKLQNIEKEIFFLYFQIGEKVSGPCYSNYVKLSYITVNNSVQFTLFTGETSRIFASNKIQILKIWNPKIQILDFQIFKNSNLNFQIKTSNYINSHLLKSIWLNSVPSQWFSLTLLGMTVLWLPERRKQKPYTCCIINHQIKLFCFFNSRYNSGKWENINENKESNEKTIFKEEMKHKKDWNEVNKNDKSKSIQLKIKTFYKTLGIYFHFPWPTTSSSFSNPSPSFLFNS